MRIFLNGEATEAAASDLRALLDERGYGDAKLATAVNEQFVPADARGARRLRDGDRVEILAPRQGG